MAPHSSTLAWKIPWTEEPGGLQSMGSGRVGHDWATSLSLFTFMHWRRKWQPTPVFLPEESQGRGAWWAAVYGVPQSQTRLKRLSSSSSSNVYWNAFLRLSPTNRLYLPFPPPHAKLSLYFIFIIFITSDLMLGVFPALHEVFYIPYFCLVYLLEKNLEID